MQDSESIISVIDKQWFEGISHEKLKQLLELSTIKECAAGDFVYMVGEQQDHIFCIVDGKVSISIIDPNGEEFGLTIWEAGYWFGESALHNGEGMPLQARARTAAKVLVVPLSAIDQVLDNGAQFYRNIVIDMISRAKLLYKLIEVLLFRPLRARVAMRVLHLVESFGEHDGDQVILPIKFSQSDFAQMSGGSRQRVNQIFRDWAEKGIVNKENKRYVVKDMVALQAELEATEE